MGPTLGASLAVAVDVGLGRWIAAAIAIAALVAIVAIVHAVAGIKGGAK